MLSTTMFRHQRALLPVVLTVMALLCLITCAVQAASTADIPELRWEQRSDWSSVKAAGAKGDGIQDDTAAIQSVLDKMRDGATIYFPPGTYRITKTLTSPEGRYLGVSLLGHGRTSTLVWDGEEKGRMFWSRDGMPNTRYVGLSWDGRGKAAVGFDHSCQKVYETEIRHQYEAYRNFTEAGIRVGHSKKVATAETLYDHCLFEGCKHGVSIRTFNDLDHTFTGCEFRKCGVGLFSGFGSNFYARNSHFEYNTESDVEWKGGEGASSVRRCTSQGSARFLQARSSVGPMMIQDCRVDGWTNADGAVVLSGAPVELFDCVFTNSPTAEGPVRTIGNAQRLFLSNNQAAGCTDFIRKGTYATIYNVPAGTRDGVVQSAAQSFLAGSVRIPGKIFDVKRDFGAKGDGVTDDTVAIQWAIEAAKAQGKGAMAYLPAGRFVVSSTLKLTGSDYYFGGSGYRTALIWKGKAGGTTIEIRDPDRITIADIAVGHHDCGMGDNAIDIRQTGTGKPSSICYDRVWVFGMYQKKPLERGLRFENLGKGDQVLFREVNGNLHFTDCAAATVYLGLSYEGTILLQGKSPKRDGFIGGSARLGTVTDPALWLKDNHSIVMSDFYVESSQHYIRMEGDNTLPAGRVTIQGAKFELADPANNGVEVNNYRGELLIGPFLFYVMNPLHRMVQQGEAPFALTLWGSVFYESKPDFNLSPTAKLMLVGNAPVGEKSSPVPDTAVAEALPRLTRAFDDLRRLGAVDLQMNYPQAK
ncbi:MAG: glycosyl hydrolase family 28-related protein [Armatimonadota bacterium]